MKTAVKNITHIEKARALQADQMSEICGLLEWTKSRFCWHQYEQFEEFIDLICKDCPDVVNTLRHSATFRGFWNNEWAMRTEREFLSFAWNCSFAIKEIETEYIFLNSAEHLLNDQTFRYRFESILKQL